MNNWFFKRSGGRTAWTLQLENRTSMSTYMKIVLSCCLKTSRSVLENEKVFFFMPCLCQNFFWLASWIIDLYVICRACLAFEARNFAVLFWAWKLFSTLFFLTFFQKPFCKSWIMFLVHSRELAIHTFFPFWIMEPKSLLKALFSRCSQ